MSRRNQSQKVVCRPCKEDNTWEIMEPNGHVQAKHYQNKNECVKKGREYAQEFGYELVVEEKQTANKQNKNNQ